MTTVGIVGAGAVGQAVATAIVAARFADHIVVASRTAEQAAAFAADVQDMAVAVSTCAGAAVYVAAGLGELHDCDAVVVVVRARFRNPRNVDVRMGGLLANAEIIHRIAAELRGYDGVVLVVTNPVDVLARLVAATAGCRVYGVGSNLDTARYRALLGVAHAVPASRVDGHVVGEHGDAAVCCLSTTRVGGVPLDGSDPRTKGALAAFLARSTMIAGGLGRVRAGAAGAVLSALHVTLGLVDGIEHLSVRYGEHGWLGQPVQFTAGRSRPRLPMLDATEHRLLDAADRKLCTAYATVRHHLSTVNHEEIVR